MHYFVNIPGGGGGGGNWELGNVWVGCLAVV